MTNLRLPPFRAFQSHLLPPGKPGPPDGSWVGFQSILYKSGNLGDQKENRAGWPGFSASSRDAVTSKRGADCRRPKTAMPKTRHSQLPTSLHRLQHRDLVGVLDVAADRNSHGDPRYLQTSAPELS